MLDREHLAARPGGDELAILFQSSTSVARFRDIGDEVVSALRTSFVIDGRSVGIACSIGIAAFAYGDVGFGMVIDRADRALYAAKASGKDQIRISDEAFDAPSIVSLQIAMELVDV